MQAKVPVQIINALPEGWRTPAAAQVDTAADSADTGAAAAATADAAAWAPARRRTVSVAGLSPFGSLRRSVMATALVGPLPEC